MKRFFTLALFLTLYVLSLKAQSSDNGDGTFTYTYVSVDDQDRNFPEKMYRFPMPTSELDNNAAVEQYPEWK